MSITDELREWAEGNTLRAGMSLRMARDQALAIADRIDAEADDNERFRREVEPFCDRLREAAAERADVTMFGVDYVALPVDADEKVIHVGDELTDGKNTYTVTSINFNSCNVVVYGHTETSKSEWPIDQTSKMHHVERPTVEGTLRELVHEVTPDVEWEDELFTEYAERIREVLRDE